MPSLGALVSSSSAKPCTVATDSLPSITATVVDVGTICRPEAHTSMSPRLSAAKSNATEPLGPVVATMVSSPFFVALTVTPSSGTPPGPNTNSEGFALPRVIWEGAAIVASTGSSRNNGMAGSPRSV